MQKFVVIVAGGSGSRMRSSIHKQFMELNGKPILMHTFEAFQFITNVQFVLVLSEKDIDLWRQLCVKHEFSIAHQIVAGGPHRFHSVKSGLKIIPNDALVAIHDGVRPFVSQETIEYSFCIAQKKGNAVPAIPIESSIRKIAGSLNKPLDRNTLRTIQTPQVFHSTAIKKAYLQTYNEGFTDDATVLETTGIQIQLVDGNKENFKITNPSDLIIAEALIASGLS